MNKSIDQDVEKYLEECIESTLNQTYSDIEIIAVNDGSTDKSLQILEKFSNKIKIISQGVIDNLSLINKNKAKKELNISGNVYLIIGNLISDSGADLILRQADKIGKTIIFATNPKGANTRNRKKTKK